MKSVHCNKRVHEAGWHEAEVIVSSRGWGHCHRGRGQFWASRPRPVQGLDIPGVSVPAVINNTYRSAVLPVQNICRNGAPRSRVPAPLHLCLRVSDGGHSLLIVPPGPLWLIHRSKCFAGALKRRQQIILTSGWRVVGL